MGCTGAKANAEGASKPASGAAPAAKGPTAAANGTANQQGPGPAADAPAEQVVRIVLKETLLSLKPKAAKAVTSAPGKLIDGADWQKCAVKVEEGAESLILHYTMAHYKGAIALAQWGKSAQTVFLEVSDLPPIIHRVETTPKPEGEAGDDAAPAEACEEGAPAGGDDGTKSTHSFIVSWKEKEGGATNRLIFGCKDEDQCNSWKTSIRQYCNIKKRFHFNYLWKLNSEIAHEGCGTDLPKSISDLSNWRIRLFSLHEQKLEDSFAMTYVSEKNGADFSVAAVVSKNGKETFKPKISRLPVISLDIVGEHDLDRFKTSVEQYRVATGYHTLPEPLPTQLHAWLVEWEDEAENNEVKRVICAAPGKITCTTWLEAIESIQKKAAEPAAAAET